VNLKDFVATIRRYWKTAAAVAGAVLVLGWTALLLTPLQYVSSTQLMVSIEGSTTADAYQNDEVVAGRVNSYIGLLTSDVVAQRVVDKLGLPVTASELAGRINATNVPPRTSVIDVAVTDESPTRAQQLAQTLAQEFIGYTNALETPTGEDAQKVHTRVVTEATAPHARVVERLVLGLLIVAAAALLAGVAVWIRSRTDPILRSADQVTAAGLAVVGTVSDEPRDEAERLEQYRRLQTRLRLLVTTPPGGDRGWVIVLSTAVVEFDISPLAAKLGRALESIGEHCIVLDACNPPPGSDESGVRDHGEAPIVVETDSDGVRTAAEPGRPKTVTMTEWAENPDQLATTVTSELFDGLRSDYDHVLVAAPPVLSSVTAAATGIQADAVLLVVHPGHTKRRDVIRASDELRAMGTRLNGVLFWQISAPNGEELDPAPEKRRFTLPKVGAAGSLGIALGVGSYGLWQIAERLLTL
jgi:capsular polysaccharide biosynthesis protein